MNALTIRLIGYPNDIHKNDSRDKNHKSEIDLDNCQDFDIYFENNKSIENLYILLELIKEKIKNKNL